ANLVLIAPRTRDIDDESVTSHSSPLHNLPLESPPAARVMHICATRHDRSHAHTLALPFNLMDASVIFTRSRHRIRRRGFAMQKLFTKRIWLVALLCFTVAFPLTQTSFAQTK